MSDVALSLVYDLKTDRSRVGAMQAASRDGTGLSDEPALVASEEWWRKVRSGELSVRTIEGTIGASYWAGHGDWPEFTLMGSDGEVSTWERYGDEERYVVGLAIRVQYVEHQWSDAAFDKFVGPVADVMIRVEIEESERRAIGPGKHP